MANRIAKVQELLRQQLSKMIIAEVPSELGLVTVTDVHVTADFKEAKVYISVFEEKNKKEVFRILEGKRLEFQRYLGRRLSMKFTPKLTFLPDRGHEEIDHVEKILSELNK